MYIYFVRRGWSTYWPAPCCLLNLTLKNNLLYRCTIIHLVCSFNNLYFQVQDQLTKDTMIIKTEAVSTLVKLILPTQWGYLGCFLILKTQKNTAAYMWTAHLNFCRAEKLYKVKGQSQSRKNICNCMWTCKSRIRVVRSKAIYAYLNLDQYFQIYSLNRLYQFTSINSIQESPSPQILSSTRNCHSF